tara:strand:- start:338 stop:1258 length:921 start_codon:yes stop_codon:yes gene_type:complete
MCWVSKLTLASSAAFSTAVTFACATTTTTTNQRSNAECCGSCGASTSSTSPPPSPSTPLDLTSCSFNLLCAELEKRANSQAFDERHYPQGLNAGFMQENSVASKLPRFENPETRDIAANVPEIAAIIGELLVVDGGDDAVPTIIDVGAGTGLMLKALNFVVGPRGSVVALELSPVFERFLQARVVAEGLHRVRTGLSDPDGLGLGAEVAEGSAHVALVCDVYHHFDYPAPVLRSIHKSLRSQGKLVVIDFYRDEEIHQTHPKGWISAHVRASKATFTREIEDAGFKLIEEPETSLKENYTLIFERI